MFVPLSLSPSSPVPYFVPPLVPSNKLPRVTLQLVPSFPSDETKMRSRERMLGSLSLDWSRQVKVNELILFMKVFAPKRI
jgi:hypothetical protein